MKTAPAFHVYVAGDHTQPGLDALLTELGLESQPLGDPAKVVHPAIIVVGPDGQRSTGLDDITIVPPADSSPSALRELLRVAMQNVVLKRQVSQLDEQAARRHRQFRELNRIGIALSAEKDIERLQSFILTSMRDRKS